MKNIINKTILTLLFGVSSLVCMDNNSYPFFNPLINNAIIGLAAFSLNQNCGERNYREGQRENQENPWLGQATLLHNSLVNLKRSFNERNFDHLTNRDKKRLLNHAGNVFGLVIGVRSSYIVLSSVYELAKSKLVENEYCKII
jgi:hypothetical protein